MRIFRKGPQSESEIIQWLREIRQNAYVPESHFMVSGIMRAKLGDQEDYYFAGTNVEYPDHRIATHGEEGCISAMITGLGKQAELVEGWVMGAPRDLNVGDDHFLADNKVTCCGKCRQQIVGYAAPEVTVHSVSLNGAMSSTTVGKFLPDAFSFRQFAPELAEGSKDAVALSAAEVENSLIRTTPQSDEAIFNWLNGLEAADFASQTQDMVVLQLTNGAYVAGVKIEEAAFQSVNPVMCAAAIGNAEFGKIQIDQAFSLSKGPNVAGEFRKISGVGQEVLEEFTPGKKLPPITLFNAAGDRASQ